MGYSKLEDAIRNQKKGETIYKFKGYFGTVYYIVATNVEEACKIACEAWNITYEVLVKGE